MITENLSVEQFKNNVDPKYRTSDPLCVVPLRSLELTPKYPAFIERLDTTYALAMPQLTEEILQRLTFYSADTELGDLSKLLSDGVGWRSNLNHLKILHPEVRYIATMPELLCAGEEYEAEIKDVRNRRVVLIPI